MPGYLLTSFRVRPCHHLAGLGILAVVAAASVTAGDMKRQTAESDSVDHGGAAARNMRVVAHDPLQARSAYQVVPHQHGNRWYLYIGHHAGESRNPLTGKMEVNGMSIVDVTNPILPEYVNHVPPPASGWFQGDSRATQGTQHVQVCDGGVLPDGEAGRVYVLRNVGDVSHEIIDVTDPGNPRFVSEVFRAEPSYYVQKDTMDPGDEQPPFHTTHKNFWACESGVAYMVSSVRDWQAKQILQAFDLSDPANPRHIRDFALPHMAPDAGPRDSSVGGRGVHEATVYGERIYVAYGVFDHGAVQILDREKFLSGAPDADEPMKPTRENLLYPQISVLPMPDYWGAHSAKPIIGMEVPDYRVDKRGSVRDFLVVVSEGVNFRCSVPRHLTFFLDITDAEHPFPVSNFQVPALDSPSGINHCRDGVFGPHAPHASFSPVYNKKVLFLAHFSGGVRAVDIRDPFHPVEVGYFIPKPTANTHAMWPSDPPQKMEGTVTNNVEIDPRGRYIYTVDRARTGLHVIELTGKAAAIVH